MVSQAAIQLPTGPAHMMGVPSTKRMSPTLRVRRPACLGLNVRAKNTGSFGFFNRHICAGRFGLILGKSKRSKRPKLGFAG